MVQIDQKRLVRITVHQLNVVSYFVFRHSKIEIADFYFFPSLLLIYFGKQLCLDPNSALAVSTDLFFINIDSIHSWRRARTWTPMRSPTNAFPCNTPMLKNSAIVELRHCPRDGEQSNSPKVTRVTVAKNKAIRSDLESDKMRKPVCILCFPRTSRVLILIPIPL